MLALKVNMLALKVNMLALQVPVTRASPRVIFARIYGTHAYEGMLRSQNRTDLPPYLQKMT